MSTSFPKQLQAQIKSLRIIAIVISICGFLTIIGIPWAVLYAILAKKANGKQLLSINYLKFLIVATIPILWCIAPIFLELALIRVIQSTKSYNKDHTKAFKSNNKWQKLNIWQQYPLVFGMATAYVLVIIMLIPVTRTSSNIIELPFQTQTIQDSNLELGERQTRQVGSKGQGLQQRKITKPVWAHLFSADAYYKIEDLPTQTTQSPSNEIVAEGTKKYQFMWCSDGSYRYFTNEQFSNKFTGFTHKSPDNCAENGQGHMTGLADTAPPQQTAPQQTPSYRPSFPTYTTCNYYEFLDQVTCRSY